MKLLSKKGFVAMILALFVVGSIAYAAFHVEYNIPTNTVSIAGIGIAVNWLGEGETVGALITETLFGMITPPASGIAYLPTNSAITNIVFVADCNGVNEKITWSTNLSSTVGTIGLEQEVYHKAEGLWYWETLASGFTLTGHQVLGKRPSTTPPSDLAKGYIRIFLKTLSTAPHGDFTFTITFKGDQV